MIRSDMELLQAVDAVRGLDTEIKSLQLQMDLLSTFDDYRDRVRSVKNAMEIDLNSYLEEIDEYLVGDDMEWNEGEDGWALDQKRRANEDAANMVTDITAMAKRMTDFYSAPEEQEAAIGGPIHLRQDMTSLEFRLTMDDEDDCGCVDGCGWRCECGCHDDESNDLLNELVTMGPVMFAGMRPENETERQARLNTEAAEAMKLKNAQRAALLNKIHQAIKPACDNPKLYANETNIEHLCQYVMELEMMCADLIEGK